MKKYLLIITAAVLAFSACGKKEEPKKDATFQITVSDVAYDEATIKVVPSDTNTLYYFSVMEQSVFDEYTSEAELVAAHVSYWKRMIDAYAQYGYDLSLLDFLSKGNDEYTWDDLTANTVYYAYAFALDTAKQELVGKVQKVQFQTSEVPFVDFSISVATTDTAVWFTPNSDDIDYIATYADVDSMGGYDNATYFEAYVQYLESYLAQYDYTLSDATYYGKIYLGYDKLEASHNYVLLAKAYTAGEFNSNLVVASFSGTPANAAPARMQSFNKHARLIELKGTELKK